VFLATTNRDLEAVAIDEIAALTGADATVTHPGMVRFTADIAAVYTLHAHARSLHRVMLELARVPFETLDDITGMVGRLDIPAYLGSDQSFAVRAKRRGEHPFGSPDVEREVGQAVIDRFRSQSQPRPAVNLDDPDLIFRVIVRGDTVTIAIDATGQRSLHRRWYRVQEHGAAFRPTLAYAMCQYAGYQPGDRLLDPMCGCGTIPIEAALTSLDRSPTVNHDPALTAFQFLDPERYHQLLRDTDSGTRPAVTGVDIDNGAVGATRANAREADVLDEITVSTGDATEIDIETEFVVTDLPFGIRTNADLRVLYDAFFENLQAGSWERAVVHTAREELVPLEVSETIPMRRGRLETSILVIE
jgi:23S rRNA G2445 N2-methylase RlmL